MIAVDKVRLQVANEHLDRMKGIQKRVKALYDVAARGGESETMAAADFYVAEAERMVAERKANLPKLSGTLPLDFVPQPTVRQTPVPVAQPKPRRPSLALFQLFRPRSSRPRYSCQRRYLPPSSSRRRRPSRRPFLSGSRGSAVRTDGAGNGARVESGR